MPPRHKCPVFNWDALIVVDDLIRGVAGRLGECPNVHGTLGRIILVKAGSLNLPVPPPEEKPLDKVREHPPKRRSREREER